MIIMGTAFHCVSNNEATKLPFEIKCLLSKKSIVKPEKEPLKREIVESDKNICVLIVYYDYHCSLGYMIISGTYLH